MNICFSYLAVCTLIVGEETVLNFSNYDLETVVTPVKVDRLDFLLKQTNYPQHKRTFLVEGFRNGFDIGYEGDQNVQLTSPNLPLRVGSPTILWNKVMKEVQAGRYAGPYEKIPYKSYIQSPIGLVPKDGGESTRLIFHLSHPKGGTTSVNANTPRHLCKVKYADIDDAVRILIHEGFSAHVSKSDLKSAFRHLGLKPSCFKWLVMMARHPVTRKVFYFIEKSLPFGSSRSCKLFQDFSDCLAHIVRTVTNRDLVNYLDDYLFAALVRAICNAQCDTFLEICGEINFPVSLEKTVRATTCITFLGFLLNTVTQTVSVPIEKIQKAKIWINYFLNKKKVTVHQAQKLCGFLNFLCRAIVPGRAFTRRLYTIAGSSKMKPHYHVNVKSEHKMDLKVWSVFVEHPSIFSRPFMDFNELLTADQIMFYTDASGKKGMGGLCDSSWMILPWSKDYLQKYEPTIQYLELFAVTAAILAWIHRFKNRRVVIFCDNKNVVSSLNLGTTSCRQCMVLVRIITLHCMIHNVRVFGEYVETKKNGLADHLSRLRVNDFFALAKKKELYFEPTPTEVPVKLMPMEKLWLN